MFAPATWVVDKDTVWVVSAAIWSVPWGVDRRSAQSPRTAAVPQGCEISVVSMAAACAVFSTAV